MKKIHLLFFVPVIFAACQSKPAADTAAAKTDTLKLAYTLNKQHDWEINSDQHNLQAALNAIKAFENNDTTAMKALIADSILVHYEGGEFKGKREDFLKAIKQEMDMYKNLHIVMEDWESVIAKDKSEEWVSLWYKQKWQNEKGGADSLQVYNDVQFKNGKLIKWVDYSRHYTPQK